MRSATRFILALHTVDQDSILLGARFNPRGFVDEKQFGNQALDILANPLSR
jgi:hypothetical protein